MHVNQNSRLWRPITSLIKKNMLPQLYTIAVVWESDLENTKIEEKIFNASKV